jgi:hypothetical protein
MLKNIYYERRNIYQVAQDIYLMLDDFLHAVKNILQRAQITNQKVNNMYL